MPSSVLPLHVQDTTEKGALSPRSANPLSARTGISTYSTQSVAGQQIDEVIAELQKANHDATHLYDASDEDTDDEDAGKPGFWHKVGHYRAVLRHLLHLPAFHITIICMVLTDLVIVFIELTLTLLNLPCYTDAQLEGFAELGIPEDRLPPPEGCQLHESSALEKGDTALWAISVSLLSIFVIELFLSGVAFGFYRHFKKPIYLIDAIIVSVSLILEVYFRYGNSGANLHNAPSTIIILRMWKIVRAVHAIAHSIEMKNQSVINRLKTTRDQLETAYQHVTEALEQQQFQIQYLRRKAPDVNDAELNAYADEEVRKLKEKEESVSEDVKEDPTDVKA